LSGRVVEVNVRMATMLDGAKVVLQTAVLERDGNGIRLSFFAARRAADLVIDSQFLSLNDTLIRGALYVEQNHDSSSKFLSSFPVAIELLYVRSSQLSQAAL
jgi:hypothetical protein